MGLNTNYHLLIEGNKSDYHIPEYKSYYNSGIITHEFAMQAIADFNQEIRESQAFISSLAEIECVTESVSMADIWDKISRAASRVGEAINNLIEKIKKIINKVIDSIKIKIVTSQDKIEKNIRFNDRIKILNKALHKVNKDGRVINISSLEPTEELMDDNFPDTSILKSDLINMTTDTMNNYCANIILKDGTIGILDNTEVKASESFVRFIDNEKSSMLNTIFGKYDYDPDNVTKSAIDVSNKAYGITGKKDENITTNLYMVACDNIQDAPSIIKKMITMRDTAESDFNKIKAEINNITKYVKNFNKFTNNNYSVDMKSNYHEAVRIITSRINRVLSVINQVINANYTLITRKIFRINEIFSANGDSMKVKKKCHSLINWYLGLNDSTNESTIYNEFNDVISEFDSIDEFASFTIMANEAFIEENYTEIVLSAINEAEDDNQADTKQNNNSDQPTENNNNDQKTNILKKAGQSIMNWLKTFMGKFGEIINRAKNRFEELVIKGDGKNFWDKNKDNIYKLTLTDTKVNQWFNFNLDSFEKSTVIKFDINDSSLKSDKEFQDKIIKIIDPNAQEAGDKESFSDRIKKAYQGEYINDEQGEGKTLSQINYNHGKVCDFINGLCNDGFGGKTLGQVSDDYKKIDSDFKDVSNRYDQISDQMPKNDETSKETQPANASAILVDDNSFNLAEHFGLMHEATFTIGQADSKIAGDTIGTNDTKGENKELDVMIKRCFQYNTLAVTAKITAAIAAYKQYMGLFKAVYKNRGNEEKSNQSEEKPEDKK